MCVYISVFFGVLVGNMVGMVMGSADWNWSVIATVVSAIATVVLAVGVFWDKISERLRPPKIQTQVGAQLPFITSTTLVKTSQLLHNTSPTSDFGTYVKTVESPCFYYHVELQNVRRRRADSCSVELSEIWSARKEGFYRRGNFVPVPLKWALIEDTSRVNIYRAQRRLIDIGYVIFDKWDDFGFQCHNGFKIGIYGAAGFGLVNEIEPGNAQDDFTGVHRLLLTILGDNFKPTTEWFELRWSGNWADTIEDIRSELSLKKCDPPPERS